MGLNEKDKVLFYIFINAEYYVFYTDEYKGLSQMFYCKISISSFRSFLSQYNLDEQTVLTIYFSLLHYLWLHQLVAFLKFYFSVSFDLKKLWPTQNAA